MINLPLNKPRMTLYDRFVNFLAEHEGELVSREMIIQFLYGTTDVSVKSSYTYARLAVSQARLILRKYNLGTIKTVRGEGYIFNAKHEDERKREYKTSFDFQRSIRYDGPTNGRIG